MRGFKWLTPGSIVALVVWGLASAAFAFYVSNFGSYNKTYGTLAGLVVLLIWMWITNLAILFGHQLNAERERSAEIVLRLLTVTIGVALAGVLLNRLRKRSRPAAESPGAEHVPAGRPAKPVGEISQGAVRRAARSLPGSREQLYREASQLGVRGRSKMNKRQLHDAVEAARSGAHP